MAPHFLEHFFAPRSIAVVGASNNPSKAGCRIMRNLTSLGYQGKVFPINPKEESIAGLPCVKSVRDVPGQLDMVVVAVPAQHVVPVMREAAERGDVKAGVIVSAGFSETKTEEGARMERELLETASRAGIRLFGPNCTGTINTAIGLDTTIEPTVEQVRGGVSVFSQSGAMAGTILLFAEEQPSPLGFNKWAHVGNMCDVDILEVLEYYGRDPDTTVVTAYMEGFDRGREFMALARDITARKPLLVLKVGRNEIGARAAFSHTGAMAGRDEVYDAAFRSCGVTRVGGVREIIDVAKAFSMQPLPAGPRLCVLTEAGGPGTMAVDRLGEHPELSLASISEQGKERLRAACPPMAIVCQPDGYTDITAAGMEQHHCDVLEIALEEDGVDAVLLISVPPTFLDPESLARAVIAKVEELKPSKPILTCLLAGKWVRSARRMLEQAGLPTFDTPEQAVDAFAKMVERGRFLAKTDGGVA